MKLSQLVMVGLLASSSFVVTAETATETQTQQRLNQNLHQQMGPGVPIKDMFRNRKKSAPISV